MIDHRYFWVFEVRGGAPVNVQPHGNPVMRHDGASSLLRCLCTDVESEQLKGAFEAAGASVKKHSPRETTEQTAERQNLFAVFSGEQVWPTAQCPTCSWLDPQVAGLCGAGLAGKDLPGWGPEVVKVRLFQERAFLDYESCPLRAQVQTHE
jgi:hypothetical protein